MNALHVGFHIAPHFIDIPMNRSFLFLIAFGFPCPHLQIAEHIHAVDVRHLPPVFQQGIVGSVDKLRQRQIAVSLFGVVSGFVSVVGFGWSGAAFVGNSDSMDVVWVCTAMRVSAMSCIRQSTG